MIFFEAQRKHSRSCRILTIWKVLRAFILKMSLQQATTLDDISGQRVEMVNGQGGGSHCGRYQKVTL
jgi:hypothetical protein